MSELSLRENGVERIRYTEDINEAVGELAQAWEEFRLLPLEEKQKLKTSNVFNGAGYENKINDSVSKDRKENFDFIRHAFDFLEEEGINLSTEANALIEAFRHLAYVSRPMLENFYHRLQPKNSSPGSTIEEYDYQAAPYERSAQGVFLRCLHYPSGAEPGTVVAEPHTDHSGGTTHFYETTDGCEMLTLDTRDWQPLPIQESEGVRFGGMQAQLFSENEVKALCHRVVANETTSQFGRSAIVGFMPIDYIKKYDRQRKGRTQDQKPGFNYDLTQVELEDYFKS